MTHVRQRSLSEPSPTVPKSNPSRTFLSMKDYERLNGLPSFSVVFRSSEDTSRSNSRGHLDPGSDAVYVHSVVERRNAVAEEFVSLQGQRPISTKQRIRIPLGYRGWFEVISQDGRSVRPIESVRGLLGQGQSTGPSPAPAYVLVRSNVNGYVPSSDGSYSKQLVREGQILKLQDTVWLVKRNASSVPRELGTDSSAATGNGNKEQFLRCVDQLGKQLHLAMDDRGRFSPIASRTCITGAHDIQSLLEKFRLPVMVRLLHGSVSQVDGADHRSRTYRLLGMYKEEVAYVVPLNAKALNRGDWKVLPVPANEEHWMQANPAAEEWHKTWIKTDEDRQRLHERCDEFIANTMSTIQPMKSEDKKSHWLMAGRRLEPDLIRDMTRCSDRDAEETPKILSAEEKQLFREIEDLYAKVTNTQDPSDRIDQRSPRRNSGTEFVKIPKVFNASPFANQVFVRDQRVRGSAWKPVQNHVIITHKEGKLIPRQVHPKNAVKHPPKPAKYILSSREDLHERSRRGELPGQVRSKNGGTAATIKENLYEEIASPEQPQHIASKGTSSNRDPQKQLSTTVQISSGTDEHKNALTNGIDGSGRTTRTRRTSEQIMKGRWNPPEEQEVIVRGKTAGAKDQRARANSFQMADSQTPVADQEGNGQFQRSDHVLQSLRPKTREPSDRPNLLRPKSYSGPPPTSDLDTGALILHPALPPKRVVSLSNLNVLAELQRHHAFATPPSPSDKAREGGKPSAVPGTAEGNRESVGFSSGKNLKPPTTTTKLFETASRSLAKTIRRIGTNRSGNAYLVNSEESGAGNADDQAVRLAAPPLRSADATPKLSIRQVANDSLLSNV